MVHRRTPFPSSEEEAQILPDTRLCQTQYWRRRMRNQAVILLLTLLGTASAHAADTDRELARQLALQQKNLLPLLSNQEYQSPLPNLLQKASPRLKRQASDANQAASEAAASTISAASCNT